LSTFGGSSPREQHARTRLDQLLHDGIAEHRVRVAVDVVDRAGRKLAAGPQRAHQVADVAWPDLIEAHRADAGQHVMPVAALLLVDRAHAALSPLLEPHARERAHCMGAGRARVGHLALVDQLLRGDRIALRLVLVARRELRRLRDSRPGLIFETAPPPIAAQVDDCHVTCLPELDRSALRA
jgi:hypothetical protein